MKRKTKRLAPGLLCTLLCALLCLGLAGCGAAAAGAAPERLTEQRQEEISETIRSLFDYTAFSQGIENFAVTFEPCGWQGYEGSFLATATLDYTYDHDPEQSDVVQGMRLVLDGLTDPEEIARVEQAIDGQLAEETGYSTSETGAAYEFLVQVLEEGDEFTYALYYLYHSGGSVTPVPAAEFLQDQQPSQARDTAWGVWLALEARNGAE